MSGGASALVTAALGLACCGLVGGQTPTSTEPAIYDSFFRLLARLQRASDDSVSIRDFIGLTDSEVKTLNAAAADYVARVDALPKPTPAEVFESRLRDIESGRVFDQASDALNDMDQKRVELIRDQLNKLKSALSESHLTLLDTYIHSMKAEKDFPLPAGPPGIVPRKKQ